MLLPVLILAVLVTSFTLALALEWSLLKLIVRVMAQATARSTQLR